MNTIAKTHPLNYILYRSPRSFLNDKIGRSFSLSPASSSPSLSPSPSYILQMPAFTMYAISLRPADSSVSSNLLTTLTHRHIHTDPRNHQDTEPMRHTRRVSSEQKTIFILLSFIFICSLRHRTQCDLFFFYSILLR